MLLFVFSFIGIVTMIIGLGISVLTGREPLRGSCGGTSCPKSQHKGVECAAGCRHASGENHHPVTEIRS